MLASQSPAVEVNAILRMVDYVQLDSNFTDHHRQVLAAHEVYATLAQFISSSTPNTSQGLQPYNSQTSLTKASLIAASQIMDLEHNRELGPWPVDLTHADLHGFSEPGITLSTAADLAAIDLREAVLTGIHISVGARVDLSNSFLTCADLYGSNDDEASLGSADLAGADLQGANLDFVDLRSVQNLTLDQVRHTEWNARTLWPAYFKKEVPPHAPWQAQNGRCTTVIANMTGMLPGEGYAAVRPWSSTDGLPAAQRDAIARVRMARLLERVS